MPKEPPVSEQATAGITCQDLAPGPDSAPASLASEMAARQGRPSLGAETAPATVEAGDALYPRRFPRPQLAGQARCGGSCSPLAARVGVWAMAALGVVGGVMLGEFDFYRFTRSMTNDAFAESHIVNLSVQVEGLPTRVHVEKQDSVRGGQVVAELDPVPATRDLELAVARRSVAEATLAFKQATSGAPGAVVSPPLRPRRAWMARLPDPVVLLFFRETRRFRSLPHEPLRRRRGHSYDAAPAMQHLMTTDCDGHSRAWQPQGGWRRQSESVHVC